MTTSTASANWGGTIKEGEGKMSFTGFEDIYCYNSRFGEGKATNPEELIGAAHAGCFSMYLSLLLTEEGLNPEDISTTAKVTMDKDDIGPSITGIELNCSVKCEGLKEDKLKELAAITKEKCPVSRLYAGGTAKITAEAKLLK